MKFMNKPMRVFATILELRANWTGDSDLLERRLHTYYLACCRLIWRLLPQDASRRGVELGEQYLAGRISAAELDHAEYEVEGAAFNIDYNCEPNNIERWAREIEALSRSDLERMLNGLPATADINGRDLLGRAAYFADYAVGYRDIRPNDPQECDEIFLSPELFAAMFEDLTDLT